MQENINSAKKSTLIIGVLFLILISILSTFVTNWLEQSGFQNGINFIISRLCIWTILLLICGYAFKIEKQPFLLWTEKKYGALIFIKGIIFTLLLLLLAMFIVGLAFRALHLNTESTRIDKLILVLKDNFPLLLFATLTAGITEELIFRGYLIPRLEILFKNTKMAIVVSSLIFGLLHYTYGTLIQIIGPVIIGLIFALQYQKYRNIKILIICHFIWDFVVIASKIYVKK